MGGHARRWLGPSACPRLPRARCLSQAGQSAHGGSRRSRPPAGRPPEPGRGRRALGCWSGLPAQGTSGAWAGSSWPRSPMLPLRDSERGPPGSPRHQHPQRHSLAFRPALAVTSSVAEMPRRPAGGPEQSGDSDGSTGLAGARRAAQSRAATPAGLEGERSRWGTGRVCRTPPAPRRGSSRVCAPRPWHTRLLFHPRPRRAGRGRPHGGAWTELPVPRCPNSNVGGSEALVAQWPRLRRG